MTFETDLVHAVLAEVKGRVDDHQKTIDMMHDQLDALGQMTLPVGVIAWLEETQKLLGPRGNRG